MNAKISSKHDTVRNSDVNYALKSSNNNELMHKMYIIPSHSRYEQKILYIIFKMWNLCKTSIYHIHTLIIVMLLLSFLARVLPIVPLVVPPETTRETYLFLIGILLS